MKKVIVYDYIKQKGKNSVALVSKEIDPEVILELDIVPVGYRKTEVGNGADRIYNSFVNKKDIYQNVFRDLLMLIYSEDSHGNNQEMIVYRLEDGLKKLEKAEKLKTITGDEAGALYIALTM